MQNQKLGTLLTNFVNVKMVDPEHKRHWPVLVWVQVKGFSNLHRNSPSNCMLHLQKGVEDLNYT